MGLLIDREGKPLGYDLFSGNAFESKTLEVALSKLEKRFGIRKVIIVADKGINSKINLKKITNRGYVYLFASRIKKLKKDIRQKIFKDDYQGRREISYKVINKIKEGNQTYELPEELIITYSPKRAQKDRADRERLIKKARSLPVKKISNPKISLRPTTISGR
jgi:transposase